MKRWVREHELFLTCTGLALAWFWLIFVIYITGQR